MMTVFDRFELESYDDEMAFDFMKGTYGGAALEMENGECGAEKFPSIVCMEEPEWDSFCFEDDERLLESDDTESTSENSINDSCPGTSTNLYATTFLGEDMCHVKSEDAVVATKAPPITLQLDALLPEDKHEMPPAVGGKTPLPTAGVGGQPRTNDVALTTPPQHSLEHSATELVAAVRLALEASGTTSSLEVMRVGHGWKIFAESRSGFFGHTESILVIAKVALLHAAEKTERTFVLGYQNQPFEERTGGFSISLAHMEDEGKACWNFYGKGFCTYGRRCYCQHPAKLVTVEVLVDQ